MCSSDLAMVAQVIKHAFSPQYAEHGLGNEGAISLAKFVMLAKIAADYAIGRIVKLQYRRQHMHGGFKLRGGEFQSKA